MNLIGESMQNNKNVLCNGDYRTPMRDVSFSSYVAGSNTKQKSNLKLKETTAHTQTNECIEGDDTSGPAFVNGLQKQNSCSKRVPITGRAVDSEISIFEAEKYFGYREEKKTDANLESTTESSKPEEDSNSRAKMRARNSQVLMSNHELYNSRNLICSPASSIVVVNECFGPGRSTPSTSSEGSWNSQSGLLSRASRNSANRSPTKGRQKCTRWWALCCKWPCSSRKSVEIEDTIAEFKLASSVSNSLTSPAPLDSPLSSARESYLGLGSYIEKQSSENFLGTASVTSDLNSPIGGGPTKSTHFHDHQYGLSKDRKFQNYLHRDCDQEGLGEEPDQRNNDGFMFPIMSVKSQEDVKPSLEVFGSPVPCTPDREQTRNCNSGMAVQEPIQPSDVRRRLLLFNLDKSRKSFTSDSNPEVHKLRGISNEDSDQGTESDSSSDLFEIESASYPLRRRDFGDDTSTTQSHYSSTACQLGFPKYFHFGGMEDAVTSSAKSCCYESQRTFASHQKR